MKFKLVKIPELSGNEASIYTIQPSDQEKTLFDEFIDENSDSFKEELVQIIATIKSMSRKTGAKAHFFKQREGKPGDLVCALYDDGKKNLRLYCIRYGTQLVVLGSGGHKPKHIRALQQDKKLKAEQELMVWLSDAINRRMQIEKDLSFSGDYLDFTGNLEFDTEEYD